MSADNQDILRVLGLPLYDRVKEAASQELRTEHAILLEAVSEWIERRDTAPTIEDWMIGVRTSYRRSVEREEYNLKATEAAVARIAAYLMSLSGNDMPTLQLLIAHKEAAPHSTIQVLMDFIATES